MESKFTGGLAGLIGTKILQFLIIVFTLGLGVPWAVCKKQRWIASHTIIDGNQVKFTGTGGGLFGQYIKWLLLSIITLGIYSLWIPIKMQQWVAEHTHTAGNLNNPSVASADYFTALPVRKESSDVGNKTDGEKNYAEKFKTMTCSVCNGVVEINEVDNLAYCSSCGRPYANPYSKDTNYRALPLKSMKCLVCNGNVKIEEGKDIVRCSSCGKPYINPYTNAGQEILDKKLNTMSCPRCNGTLKISLACSNCGTSYTNPNWIAEVLHLGEEEQYNPSKVTQKDKVKIVKCRVCDGEVKILDGKDIARCSVCGKPYKITKKVE